MAIPGLSTLGIQVGYKVVTAMNALPSSGITALPRCNSIDGIEITPASIDASALEDYVTQRVAGRSDIPDTWNLTFNNTPAVRTALSGLISAYNSETSADKVVCIEVYDPKDTAGAFWVFVQPSAALSLSEVSQNTLKTLTFATTPVTVYGYAAGVAPTAASG